MKDVLVVLFLCLSAQLIAQENEHLKGSGVEEPAESNAIQRISSLRNALEVDVLAYPNPSNGDITVSAPELSVLTLYLDNGVYVGTWNVDHTGKVEMADLPSGMLILTIVKDSERVVRKVVVL
jgi:hypothetical protein